MSAERFKVIEAKERHKVECACLQAGRFGRLLARPEWVQSTPSHGGSHGRCSVRILDSAQLGRHAVFLQGKNRLQ